MCSATLLKAMNKNIQGETRVICEELFALLLFRAGWLKKTRMPVVILKHISPFSEFQFSGSKMCSVMEKIIAKLAAALAVLGQS